jgi:hypothetical protein
MEQIKLGTQTEFYLQKGFKVRFNTDGTRYEGFAEVSDISEFEIEKKMIQP